MKLKDEIAQIKLKNRFDLEVALHPPKTELMLDFFDEPILPRPGEIIHHHARIKDYDTRFLFGVPPHDEKFDYIYYGDWPIPEDKYESATEEEKYHMRQKEFWEHCKGLFAACLQPDTPPPSPQHVEPELRDVDFFDIDFYDGPLAFNDNDDIFAVSFDLDLPEEEEHEFNENLERMYDLLFNDN